MDECDGTNMPRRRWSSLHHDRKSNKVSQYIRYGNEPGIYELLPSNCMTKPFQEWNKKNIIEITNYGVKMRDNKFDLRSNDCSKSCLSLVHLIGQLVSHQLMGDYLSSHPLCEQSWDRSQLGIMYTDEVCPSYFHKGCEKTIDRSWASDW